LRARRQRAKCRGTQNCDEFASSHVPPPAPRRRHLSMMPIIKCVT
jgi:hypothetical protein